MTAIDADGGPDGEPPDGGYWLGFRGALGFLSRLPVGTDRSAWAAFRRRPATFVLAGYAVGLLVALPFAVPLPAPALAVAYPAAVVVVTGINHVDGVADLGDAAAVHGGPGARREALKDTTLGVGGATAVALVVAGLALAGLGLAALPPRRAVGVVVAAEVSAKLGMAAVACLGRAAHGGLGSQLIDASGRGDLWLPVGVALPAALLAWPSPAAGIALAAGALAALGTLRWAGERLGGATGDVFGATNELARVTALHAGVVAWTLS